MLSVPQPSELARWKRVGYALDLLSVAPKVAIAHEECSLNGSAGAADHLSDPQPGQVHDDKLTLIPDNTDFPPAEWPEPTLELGQDDPEVLEPPLLEGDDPSLKMESSELESLISAAEKVSDPGTPEQVMGLTVSSFLARLSWEHGSGVSPVADIAAGPDRAIVTGLPISAYLQRIPWSGRKTGPSLSEAPTLASMMKIATDNAVRTSLRRRPNAEATISEFLSALDWKGTSSP
jgi:hypothetical protein